MRCGELNLVNSVQWILDHSAIHLVGIDYTSVATYADLKGPHVVLLPNVSLLHPCSLVILPHSRTNLGIMNDVRRSQQSYCSKSAASVLWAFLDFFQCPHNSQCERQMQHWQSKSFEVWQNRLACAECDSTGGISAGRGGRGFLHSALPPTEAEWVRWSPY